MSDIIQLPSERVEQLRALSRNRNLPIADLIAEFVNDQVAKGHLDRAIPTIDVRRNGDHVEIDFGTFKRTFGLELARAYAINLRWLARPKSDALKSMIDSMSGTELVGLSRRGTSVKATGEDGSARTLAPSIARELATLIEDAAK